MQFFINKIINGEDGEIYQIGRWGRRGMGCWRLEMANTNDNNIHTSTELKRGDANIQPWGRESLNCGLVSFKQKTSFRGSQNILQKVSRP